MTASAKLALVVLLSASVPAGAQPKRDTKPAPATPAKDARPGKPKEQNFNFDGLGITGKNRSPQLLYFLERANEELERASLEKRSFIPRLVRTVEEEPL